jgi:hypothetical protein
MYKPSGGFRYYPAAFQQKKFYLTRPPGNLYF